MGAKRVRLLAWTGAALAAIGLLVAFGLTSSGSGVKGRLAPALPTEQLVGAATTLASLQASSGGRPAVVVFWASWCDPCVTEAAAIERFSRSAAGRGRVVGVDWNDAAAGARAFIRVHGWTFPNLRDGEGTIGNSYGLTGLPTTIVLDGRGRIRTALRGPQTERSLGNALAAAAHS